MKKTEEKSPEEKPIKEKPLLFLIIFCILLLIAGIYLRTKNGKSLEEIFSSSKMNLNIPETMNLNALLGQGEITPKEFLSPDGKLKIDYSSDWQESSEKDLKEIDQSLLTEEEEFIFLARKINIEKQGMAIFLIQEIENKTLSGVVEMIKEKDEKTKIINSEIGEKEAFLELIYGGESSLQAKEKLILNNQKIYLIAFFAPEKDWVNFKEEVEKILASAKIVE